MRMQQRKQAPRAADIRWDSGHGSRPQIPSMARTLPGQGLCPPPGSPASPGGKGSSGRLQVLNPRPESRQSPFQPRLEDGGEEGRPLLQRAKLGAAPLGLPSFPRVCRPVPQSLFLSSPCICLTLHFKVSPFFSV